MREHKRHLLYRCGGWLAAAVVLGLAPAALADTLTWRQTSVLQTQSQTGAVRQGVAIFEKAMSATMTVQLSFPEPPVGRDLLVVNVTTYRFEDGSMLRMQGRSTAKLLPEGMPMRGESMMLGEVIGGTGRYQGATGTYKMRIRTDISLATDGALGDYFGEGTAEVTLAK